MVISSSCSAMSISMRFVLTGIKAGCCGREWGIGAPETVDSTARRLYEGKGGGLLSVGRRNLCSRRLRLFAPTTKYSAGHVER